MDFSTLPPEVQFNYLLELPAQEVLSYCGTSTSARAICQDPYFWDQKAIKDFGAPFSAICEMSPYWKYQFMREMQWYPAMIGPLVRAGYKDLAREIFRVEGFSDSIIQGPILADDITTLEFLRPHVPKIREQGIKYGEDPLGLWVLEALMNGSAQSLKFLLSIEPRYLENPDLLDNILGLLIQENAQQGIRMLGPHIEKIRGTIMDQLDALPALKDYLENRI